MFTRAWVWYTVIRLGVIIVVFGGLALLGVPALLAATIGVLVAALVSFVGLGRLRGGFSAELADARDRRRADKRDRDAVAEDAAVDAAASTTPYINRAADTSTPADSAVIQGQDPVTEANRDADVDQIHGNDKTETPHPLETPGTSN